VVQVGAPQGWGRSNAALTTIADPGQGLAGSVGGGGEKRKGSVGVGVGGNFGDEREGPGEVKKVKT
jgi:hypothetical protein